MAPRETANNAYAKFWDDKQKVLWCVVVFSGVVNNCRSVFNSLVCSHITDPWSFSTTFLLHYV